MSGSILKALRVPAILLLSICMVLNFATYTALALIYLIRGIDIDDFYMFVINFGVSIIVLYYIIESILYCCFQCFCRDQKCGLYVFLVMHSLFLIHNILYLTFYELCDSSPLECALDYPHVFWYYYNKDLMISINGHYITVLINEAVIITMQVILICQPPNVVVEPTLNSRSYTQI